MSSKRIAVTVSTETEDRQVVVINGAEYEMVSAEDLELKDALWLAKAGRQIQGAASGDYCEEDIERIGDTLDRMLRAVLPSLPDEVFAKLRSRHKIAIASAFTTAAVPSGEAPRQSGTDTSPASSASTAAAEPIGSAPQQQPSGDTSS